ncbi:MAG TPA: dienelactone hydrolase family protein [Candidatus Saccharimonadales bacterium]|nr:dienelactone hydrolase family protein [Candidatus Saccharimonadales bacterium]
MAWSYVLVGILAIGMLIGLTGKMPQLKKRRLRRALKGAAVGMSLVLVGITAFLAYALPVFKLPEPTGKYPVGFTYMQLTDHNRTDPFLAGSSQKRQLMVKVYYPAKADGTKLYAPYFNGSKELMEAYAGFYHIPSFAFTHFGLVQTHAKANLTVSGAEKQYPVVLFSNGAGATPEVETSQSEDLASHGYIVMAIDHTYVSAATQFPSRVVTAAEATRKFDVPEPAAPITQIMADDDKFVIDELTKINGGSIASPVAHKVNAGKIGVIGHSVGGAVAYNMAINDPRVKAAINLDGAVYITPKPSQPMAPFLMLANDKYHVEAIKARKSLMMQFDSSAESQAALRSTYGSKAAYDQEYAKEQADVTGLANTLKASGNLYTITGSDHMKFTDIGLFIGNAKLRSFLQIGGSADPKDCLAITQAVTSAFFNEHLRGGSAEPVNSLTNEYPKLQHVKL